MTFTTAALNIAGQLAHLNDADLRYINQLAASLIKDRGVAKLREFRVGDTVEFFYAKQARTVTGRITSINRKTVSLTESGGHGAKWRVPAALVGFPEPVAKVSPEVADAFGMRNLPNVVVA